jgi:hypothetical protein
MQATLIEKLHRYIIDNNPDLLLNLQQGASLTEYIETKVNGIRPMIDELTEAGTPAYLVEEQCMYALTKDLRPSKYNYIREVFESEFEETGQKFRDSGILTYEIVNMIAACEPVFTELGFSEDKTEDKTMRQAVVGTIAEYLERK